MDSVPEKGQTPKEPEKTLRVKIVHRPPKDWQEHPIKKVPRRIRPPAREVVRGTFWIRRRPFWVTFLSQILPLLIAVVAFGIAITLLHPWGIGQTPEVVSTTPPTTPTEGGGAAGYSYWKGPIPGSYYVLNIDGIRATKVTGKPWMVLEYDKISGDIIDLEFGLSEVTIERVSNLSAITPPMVEASWVDFAEKLGLKGPVDMIVTWNNYSISAVSHSGITYGPGTFSFRNGSSVNRYQEEWTFTYSKVADFNRMVGGVKNIVDIENDIIFGRDSEPQAFQLMKQ